VITEIKLRFIFERINVAIAGSKTFLALSPAATPCPSLSITYDAFLAPLLSFSGCCSPHSRSLSRETALLGNFLAFFQLSSVRWLFELLLAG